jgi:uncharacterized damage-inducible protein DinB
MYTSEALTDLHERTHRSLAKLLAHCEALPAGAVDRSLDGFGSSTVRLQIHHVLGAERYWLSVILGRMDARDDDADFPTIASLAALRADVAAATRDYLRSATPAELNTPRAMLTWGGREQVLVPARIVLRTQTHAFHHQGQIVAMCRLLGSPASGLDFPIA